MNEPTMNTSPQTTESVSSLKLHNTKPQKTAQDWVRDMRMSAAVNKSNTGVETDQVTPELMLATSKKLLGISKREQEPDAKDSLAFQRFYGPEMLFQERILRDGGKLARNILWKATNRGNLDFMPVNALEKHISSVFYDSKLAQMMDGSSPLETIDAAYKTTRIGEGGVSSMDSAPDEMRTVQPSYFGFIDPVRCFAKGTEIKTEDGWKAIENVTTEDKTLVKTEDGYKYLPIKQTYKFSYSDVMIGYDDGVVGFLVTPHHRLYVKDGDRWRVDFAENLYGSSSIVNLSETEEQLHTLDPEKWYRGKSDGYVYCVTVENELIMTRFGSPNGLVILNSPESFRVGLDVYMTKNVMKGTDGKLYQKFIDAKTGKEVLLDSETAANSVIAAPEMRNAKTKSIFALGGPTGVRIVPRDSVQYYLPRADEAYSTSSNLVTMLSGVKEMRLQMGCLHPDTQVLTIDKKNLINIDKAQVTSIGRIPGSTKEGQSKVFDIRTTVAKFPPKRNWFYKIVLRSGRSLITSADHRWSVLRKGQYQLIPANKLKPGDQALRTTFKDVISRRTFVNGIQVNKDIAKVFGYIARSLAQPDNEKLRITIPESEYSNVMRQLSRLGYTEGFNTYYVNYAFCIGIRDPKLKAFLIDAFGPDDRSRKLPSFILSANAAIVAAFLDGYTSDPTKVGKDSVDDIWILELPNQRMRDSIAFLFARIETDTLYRDCVEDGVMHLALKLVPMEPAYGDMLLDEIKVVKKGIPGPIMVDIDVNDNLYATANGIVTHNSKYPLQAISVQSREAPLVRGLDEASGKDMHSLIGKYLGARFAPQDGIVTAVRKDRIDVQYADGTKGSVDLYVNFPMNAKGFINNKPQVKAGQAFKKGDCLASSNYTDDKGVAALGTNLRSAWMSWKGGTYEDAIVISESAAKKLTSDTMYKTSIDLDKTVKLGKKNYLTWKPGEFTKEQMEALDDNGIVKPGTVLHKEDPMILAVRMTEPSPGTMGKRILTDMSERWEHDHPGVVTDVVKTRNGIKVYATVTAPAQIGDKLSGCFDDRTEIFTNRGFVLFKDLLPTDKVAVLNKDGSARFEKPKAYQIDEYKGCMIEHKSRRTSMMVTPNHDIAHVPRYEFEKGDTQLVKKKAADVYGSKIFMRVSACFDGELARPIEPDIALPEYTLSYRKHEANPARLKNIFNRKDFAAFLGIYLAEGTLYHNRPGIRSFKISQYDNVEGGKERCKQIADLLNRMGIEWHYYNHQYFQINNWPIFLLIAKLGDSYGKHIPEFVFSEWSKEDIEILLDWFYLGDGEKTVSEDGSHRCATVSKRLADDLQRLYILTGKYSNVHYTAAKNAKSGLVYKISSAYKEFIGYGVQKSNWRIVDDYDGMVYCVTTSTGVVLTRRDGIVSWNGQSYGNKSVISQIIPDSEMPVGKDGKPIEVIMSPLGIISRCNPAQLFEAQLGKIAAKTGKPAVIPHFMDESISEYVDKQLKQNGLKATDDLTDPTTGREMKGVATGVSYIYKLKHLADSKLSARGTGTYDSELQPGGKGMDGCFPGDQVVAVRNGWRTIRSIASSLNSDYVTSCGDDRKPRYFRAIDRFKKVVPAEDIITVTPSWSFDMMGYYRKKVYTMSPTKNHAIYMYDMTQKHAGDLKVGDKLAGMGIRPSDDQMQVIANFLSMPGIVENDTFTVAVGADHSKLLYFKYKMLRSLGAKLDKENNILSLPNYALYNAAITEADFGELAVCLHQLDSDATCSIDGKVSPLIAKWLPARYIPDTKPELKEFVKKAQAINPPMELNMQPAMGVMPIIVAKIEQYKTDKPSVTVYDLTIENTHKYVLKGGFLVSNSKRFGTLEQSALTGHGVFEIIKDSKWVRGQSNSDFWRSIRTGDIPTVPGEPLVHKKFFAHLTGSGINVKKTPQGVSIFALTNKDVNELAGPRELKSRDTYEAKNFRPIDGGLFGQDIFGINGDKWGYIQLDSPVPNPVMEEPLARLLGIPEKKFADVAAGKEEINGIKGGASMKAALEKINLDAESAKALNNFKTATPSGKDKMLKRYIAIERMRRAGVKPSEYMLDKIPVIPPIYRPISSHNGLTMVADSNYLYAQLMDARDDAREAKDLPAEYQQQAEENIYTKWKELAGLYAPQDVKLQSKHVNGLLKWALGTGTPKGSAFQRKVLSATVDTVGRGVVTPDPRLKLNELGIPETMAFNIMGPMVARKLVKEGYTPIQAMEKVKKRDVQARDALNEVMNDHPVMMNRAPTLHKLSIMAFRPRLVTGDAIRVNPSIVVPYCLDHDGDAVNVHVPVSLTAIQEAYNHMFPERNLIGMRNRQILYKPEKEYQQGLYIATRMKSGPDVRTRYFNTLEEARQAYRDGLIDVDDPIVIKDN